MKTFFYLLASATLTVACQSQPTSYKITGNLEEGINIQDNTLAVLLKMGPNGPERFIDTATVVNRQFVFEGKADSVDFAQIYFFKKGENKPCIGKFIGLFLENGDITIQCKNYTNIITGSINNNILSKYITQQNNISQPYYDALTQYQTDTTQTKEQRNKMFKQIEDIRKNMYAQVQELTKKYINENINNFVGYTLFIQNANSLYNIEEKENIISKLPPQYSNRQELLKIKENIAISKRTAIGQKFINFTMKTPNGQNITLAEIVTKNKITLIDFWASWCGPCRAEMPNVVSAYQTFKSKGLEIVGVSLDDNAKQWTKAIEDLKITWPQISDLKGWKCEAAQLYNIQSIPSTILIGQNGVILAKNLRGKELENKLNELLK